MRRSQVSLHNGTKLEMTQYNVKKQSLSGSYTAIPLCYEYKWHNLLVEAGDKLRL